MTSVNSDYVFYYTKASSLRTTNQTNSNSTRNGSIENTTQGDCWLLSAINALSYTEDGAEIIGNLIEYDEDGITINLEGGTGSIL